MFWIEILKMRVQNKQLFNFFIGPVWPKKCSCVHGFTFPCGTYSFLQVSLWTAPANAHCLQTIPLRACIVVYAFSASAKPCSHHLPSQRVHAFQSLSRAFFPGVIFIMHEAQSSEYRQAELLQWRFFLHLQNALRFVCYIATSCHYTYHFHVCISVRSLEFWSSQAADAHEEEILVSRLSCT